MDENIKEELKQIVETILSNINVNEIYLFGSFAYGKTNQNSDFDLYAVLPDDSEKTLTVIQKINQLIFSVMKRPVDVLASKSSTFYERANYPTLEKEVLSKGIKLYGNDDQLRKTVA